MSAKIASIVYTPMSVTVKSDDKYDREPAEKAQLRASHGIVGDRKAGHHPKRHLNIMSAERLDELSGEGFHTAPGQMGEQIILSGIDIDALQPGDRLRLGADAIVVINEPRTGCEKFEAIQGQHPSVVQGRLGMMASVIASGAIAVGDPVAIEPVPTLQGFK